MSTVLKNGLLLLDGYELTGAMNAIGLSYGADAEDDTRLGNDTHIAKGGLKTVKCSMKGYWDGTTDESLQGDVGVDGAIVSVMGQDPTVGSIGYFFESLIADYQLGAKIGSNLPFSADAEGQGSLVRAQLGAMGAKTASGSGTALNLGAVSAAQKVWAALHVVGKSGTTPSVTVTIESAPTSGFASPTTQLTFNAATDVGAQLLSKAGAITDTWWRAKWSVSGTTPSLKIYVLIGIQ